jgi:NTE family protein
MTASHRPRIGLALGSGSARGWGHIGVIQALAEAGIAPDIVCGTSIGALVGAAYAAGDLARLQRWANGITWQKVMPYLDFSLEGGLIKGDKLTEFCRSHFVDREISKLARPFATVATELRTGREVWLREGMVFDAVRASIALPGLLTPVGSDGQLLVDGGLVNPVPVSLCRAMGADLVIAVDLNSDLIGRHFRKDGPPAEPFKWTAAGILGRLRAPLRLTRRKGPPSVLDVLASSINIMQMRITRSRLAGDPADVVITPRLAHLGLLEFHRAREAADAGRQAVAHALPQIRQLLEDN